MTLSKRGNEVIGYVVRDGKERGKGRYLNECPGPGPAWGERGVLGRDTCVWSSAYTAHFWTTRFGGRVVAVVRKSKPAKLVATEEDSARYVTAYNAMHSIDWSDRCLAGIQAVLDGRAADLRALSPESGEPPEGSRLWRCEKELAKARRELRDTKDALVAAEALREDAEEKLGSVGEPAKDASSGASDAKGAAIAVASGVPAPSHADAGVVHVPSLREWLRSWGPDGTANWIDATGKTVPILKATFAALLDAAEGRGEHAKQLDILRADLARMREERDEVEDQFRIARADLARMTEQRDASTERERGLAAKLEAVREALR